MCVRLLAPLLPGYRLSYHFQLKVTNRRHRLIVPLTGPVADPEGGEWGPRGHALGLKKSCRLRVGPIAVVVTQCFDVGND